MRMMNEFEAQVLSDLSVLKTQMTNLAGDGTGGRIADLEHRMERHEQNWQRAKGFLAAVSVVFAVLEWPSRVAPALIHPAPERAAQSYNQPYDRTAAGGRVMGSKGDYEVLVAAVEILPRSRFPRSAHCKRASDSGLAV